MMKTRLWHGLMTTTCVLLILCMGATSIANAHEMDLNTRLGTTNYMIVNDDDAVADTAYFKSEFAGLGDLISAKEALCEQIAADGCVLLKNTEDALPLNIESETVTLWGLNSHNPTLGGMIGSSANVSKDAGQKLYDIETAFTARGFRLNQTMIELYSGEAASKYARKNGHGLTPMFGKAYEAAAKYNVGEMPAGLYSDEALASADGTAAIVVISRDNSEAADYSLGMVSSSGEDRFDRPMALSDNEQAMIELAKAHSTKVVVLLNVDNPVEIDGLKRDDGIDAILWCGLPGVNGFLGVADTLSGVVNPSGHLPDTYATHSASSPAMVNFGLYMYTNNSQAGGPLTGDDKGDWYVVESEGIYTGYKYYETRYEDAVWERGNAVSGAGAFADDTWHYETEVSYPFGYGLSYTSFTQKLQAVEVTVGGQGHARVEVTNAGNVPGRSVVQLYVQTPYTPGGIEKSAIQLVGYSKTAMLEPGATETVTVDFDPKYMASYDETAVKENVTPGAWVLEAGEYVFAVGNGAHEALNNVLAMRRGSAEGLFINEGETVNSENTQLWSLSATDIETYSQNVTNAFEDCNINRLIEGTVVYTTRTDWTKGWIPVQAITPTDGMMTALTNRTYPLHDNGDGLTWGADNHLQLVDMLLLDDQGQYSGVLPFDDPQWDMLIDEITLDEAIAFLGSGGHNIPSINLPETFRNDGPTGFARDQVGGYFVRWNENNAGEPTYVKESDEKAAYSMQILPTEPVLAATFDAELARRVGEILGEDALWANEDGILTPGLNLHRNPYCARNHEYFSEDAMLTNLMGVALCAGGRSKGLMMQPKHLAFNHQELNRSGVSTYFCEQAARENELRAFQGACESNEAQGIMTAFNRLGAQFAGAHEGMLIQVLRTEWGFLGWVTTDMINGPEYMNWRATVYAGGGNSLTDTAFDSSQIGKMADSKALIERDTAFQARMKEMLKYWAYNCASSSAINGFAKSSRLVYVRTWWQNALVAVDIGFAFMTVVAAAFYVLNTKKKKEDVV